MIFDSPFQKPPYQDVKPEYILNFNPCQRPQRTHPKEHAPVAGDTVFVNNTNNPKAGFWAVLVLEELQ